MRIEIINTGSELMLGHVLNTHPQWLCRMLSDRGYEVQRQVAVADTTAAIVLAFRDSLSRADLVITTGGLGPTSDDLTRNAIAELCHLTLEEDPTVVAHIERWYASRQRAMPLSTRVQAQVPAGARVLHNAHGTAPGLIVTLEPNPCQPDRRKAWLVMLPGPPRELRPMVTDQVLPWLAQAVPAPPSFVCVNLRSTGLGESQVEERIAGPLASLVGQGVAIGYCARPGEVDIRLAAQGELAGAQVAEAQATVLSLIGEHVYGTGDERIEAVVVRRLAGRRQTVSTAESCTGGRLASRITDVAGASEVFAGGVVTYTNALKQQLLGVPAEVLRNHGAVSRPVAEAMAAGSRDRFQTDYALAVTGIAGPSGGSAEKPVGTVFIALATPHRIRVLNPVNTFDRDTFKQVTTQQALALLQEELRR